MRLNIIKKATKKKLKAKATEAEAQLLSHQKQVKGILGSKSKFLSCDNTPLGVPLNINTPVQCKMPGTRFARYTLHPPSSINYQGERAFCCADGVGVV